MAPKQSHEAVADTSWQVNQGKGKEECRHVMDVMGAITPSPSPLMEAAVKNEGSAERKIREDSPSIDLKKKIGKHGTKRFG